MSGPNYLYVIGHGRVCFAELARYLLRGSLPTELLSDAGVVLGVGIPARLLGGGDA